MYIIVNNTWVITSNLSAFTSNLVAECNSLVSSDCIQNFDHLWDNHTLPIMQNVVSRFFTLLQGIYNGFLLPFIPHFTSWYAYSIHREWFKKTVSKMINSHWKLTWCTTWALWVIFTSYMLIIKCVYMVSEQAEFKGLSSLCPFSRSWASDRGSTPG